MTDKDLKAANAADAAYLRGVKDERRRCTKEREAFLAMRVGEELIAETEELRDLKAEALRLRHEAEDSALVWASAVIHDGPAHSTALERREDMWKAFRAALQAEEKGP